MCTLATPCHAVRRRWAAERSEKEWNTMTSTTEDDDGDDNWFPFNWIKLSAGICNFIHENRAKHHLFNFAIRLMLAPHFYWFGVQIPFSYFVLRVLPFMVKFIQTTFQFYANVFTESVSTLGKFKLLHSCAHVIFFFLIHTTLGPLYRLFCIFFVSFVYCTSVRN